MRVPGPSRGHGGWHLSAGGVPVPPVPEGVDRDYAIGDVRRALTPEQAADPRWRPDNNEAFWDAYFRRRRQEDLESLGNNGTVEGRHNCRGRRRWWGGDGRNLDFALSYIAAGNEPRLTMPPPRAWQPRRVSSVSLDRKSVV